MTAGRPRHNAMPRLRRLGACSCAVLAVALVSALSACGSDGGTGPTGQIVVSSITVDSGSRVLERGTQIRLTATVRDASGTVITTVPVAWRTTVDSVASVDRDGVLTAGDTGISIVDASALGVRSAPIGIHVVWVGAAKIESVGFVAPNAVTPGAVVDSLRVAVTNLAGGLVANTLVAFSVSAGDGSVSSSVVSTGNTGFAAVEWRLGATPGSNKVTAAVVKGDSSTLIPWVEGNPIAFSITTFGALTAVSGADQSGTILSTLPIAPAVKLVDLNGNPRAGIPITFTATSNGRVATPVVSTGADGVASPGSWTLGDAPGDEQLIATVESAKLVLHATATGTPVHFMATDVATSQAATCARTSDQLVSCFGAAQLTGRNETAPRSKPATTTGDVPFTNVAGGLTHFCGVALDQTIYCWGPNALTDTTGATTSSSVPAKVLGTWTRVSPGGAHNCALAADQTASCWGANESGQLGDNTTTNRFAPRPVIGGFHFAALAAGLSHECGLSTTGDVFCWGSNSSGQLGSGTQAASRITPTAISSTDKFTAIGAGANWTCGLSDGGKAECWGAGTGQATPKTYSTAFTAISVGAAHACALTSDGVAYCWGDNSGGQLGDSTLTTRDQPTAVVTTLRFGSISAGVQHTCGITLDGSVACWGRNQSGEIGVDPSLTRQLTPRLVVVDVHP